MLDVEFLLKKIKKNTKLNENHLITLRPNSGIPAENWNEVLKKVKKDLKAGHNLNGLILNKFFKL